ncbi:hypothetical protein AJ78_04172 [Emergomyces pasteurianus Ep9510]|uniref:Uncharacterized protein n=1 Tax=Emergomyces pasteurianus Ep9510 TaxID=1447872 RepID=A0A1J9PHU0_9EURO|nr:hypothetical protein AJ78_04172 [Emergomyces pasteurianus Ep9510]
MSKKAPRLWDRKPMTPFNSRSRSHKVWKRFLVSTSNDIGEDRIDHDTFLTEINNSSAHRGILRGVKRRCTAACVGVERGRSFLETKWEAEDMGARKRKCVPQTENCRWESVDGPYALSDADDIELNKCVEKQRKAAQKVVDENELGLNWLAGQHDNTRLVSCQTLGIHLQDPEDPAQLDEQDINMDNPTTQGQTGTLSPETYKFEDLATSVPVPQAENALIAAAKVEEIAEEAVTPLAMPPSRPLFPTLEGDDADFITDFLSQAQAKRAAAKSAVPSKESENASWEDPGRSPTPRPRRVLKDLDKNSSPSSPRQQQSPSKLRQTPISPCLKPAPAIGSDEEDIEHTGPGQIVQAETEEDLQQPRAGTPWRRSTRKSLSRTQRHTPTVPNHIPVRRSNGTEFVFLQRSEEQQLSLTTKANTRRNKGDAQFPCFVLQAINAKEYDPFVFSNGETAAPVSPRKSPRKRIRIVKKVMWDDEHLVQFEGETYDNDEQIMEISRRSHSPKPAISQPIKREKKKKNQDHNPTGKSSNKSTTDEQPLTTHSELRLVKSPMATKKVRKLGFSGNSEISSINHNIVTLPNATTTAPPSTKSSTSTRKIASHPGTPIQRKKLAPKSPKAIVFKVSDNRAPNISAAAKTAPGSVAPTTRAAAKKFGGSFLPRHAGRTRV